MTEVANVLNCGLRDLIGGFYECIGRVKYTNVVRVEEPDSSVDALHLREKEFHRGHLRSVGNITDKLHVHLPVLLSDGSCSVIVHIIPEDGEGATESATLLECFYVFLAIDIAREHLKGLKAVLLADRRNAIYGRVLE